jgi:hypothetical protein
MGNYLHCLSKIISTTFLGNDMVIDLASGDVVVTSKGNAQITFVVAKVQICFRAVVADEHFTVSSIVLINAEI